MCVSAKHWGGGGGGGGGGTSHKPSWTLCEQLVRSQSLFFYSSSFSHLAF